MFNSVKSSEIPWVAESVRRFGDWLVEDAPGDTWTRESLERPGIFRWTVSWIRYEGLFEWLWSETWFQVGIQAFGLMALEIDGEIELLESEAEGAVFVRCPDGVEMELPRFLAGESLTIRHDPDFADLLWDPVSAMSHVLSEYKGPV